MQLIISTGTHIPTNGIAEICIYVGEMIATIMVKILEHYKSITNECMLIQSQLLAMAL